MPDFERIVDDLAEEKPPSLWTTHEICAVQTVWRNRVLIMQLIFMIITALKLLFHKEERPNALKFVAMEEKSNWFQYGFVKEN